MVWIALILLGLTTALVAVNTAAGRWGMDHWRSPQGSGLTFQQWWVVEWWNARRLPASMPSAGPDAILGAWQAVLDRSGFFVFSNWIVFSIFLSFLLPIWSLSFATEAIGGEQESRSLVWLLSRPTSRWGIYLAKFVALLPWGLGLNLGGFALLCLAAGRPGLLALSLYWPAVLAGSLAFCSLFHLMGACFRRAAVVAIVYSFFLETVLGNMPGYMKRISIGFYSRCLMLEAMEGQGIHSPEKPSVFMPVDGTTAWTVLLSLTVLFLIIGMVVFSRSEYHDLS
jgi:ABC-type transport system involved in multi-copper enzyme maturation permease subunit